jgi:hypothetical protein
MRSPLCFSICTFFNAPALGHICNFELATVFRYSLPDLTRRGGAPLPASPSCESRPCMLSFQAHFLQSPEPLPLASSFSSADLHERLRLRIQNLGLPSNILSNHYYLKPHLVKATRTRFSRGRFGCCGRGFRKLLEPTRACDGLICYGCGCCMEYRQCQGLRPSSRQVTSRHRASKATQLFLQMASRLPSFKS